MSARNPRGYTLIEMMVVIVIMGIVMAFALGSFTEMQVNSRMSAYASELVMATNEARSRARATKSAVVILQGVGTSNVDTAAASVAGNWAAGWRIVDQMAAPTLLSRNIRSNSSTSVVTVANGKVIGTSPNFTADGIKINGFGFNGFGRLVMADGTTALQQVSIIICDPKRANERGRVIAISLMGIITSHAVNNPTTLCTET